METSVRPGEALAPGFSQRAAAPTPRSPILAWLGANGPATAREIAVGLGRNPDTMSAALAPYLKRDQVVRVDKRGRALVYALPAGDKGAAKAAETRDRARATMDEKVAAVGRRARAADQAGHDPTVTVRRVDPALLRAAGVPRTLTINLTLDTASPEQLEAAAAALDTLRSLHASS
jgi:hypothetical protein